MKMDRWIAGGIPNFFSRQEEADRDRAERETKLKQVRLDRRLCSLQWHIL
jgi:hypothetical protein